MRERDSKIEAISRDIVSLCLHIFFWGIPRDDWWWRETFAANAEVFGAFVGRCARLAIGFPRSSGDAVAPGSVVPCGNAA